MTRQVAWARIVAEGTAIVLSILLAFGIQAWWDDRQESQRLDAALVGIAEGLVESQAALEQHVEQVRAALGRVNNFLAMSVAEAGRIPADETSLYLAAIQRPYTQDDNLTFLRLALDDGILKELSDHEFQAALVEWREALNQLDEVDRALAAHWPEALAVLSKHEAVGRALAGSAGLRPDVGAQAMGPVRSDPEVFAIAARKAVFMGAQANFLPRLAAAESRLLRAIEPHLPE